MPAVTDAAAPRTTLSLQARIALAIGAVVAIGGILVLIAALAYGRHAAREAFDRLLVGAASDIAIGHDPALGNLPDDVVVGAVLRRRSARDEHGGRGAELTGASRDERPWRPSAHGVSAVVRGVGGIVNVRLGVPPKTRSG